MRKNQVINISYEKHPPDEMKNPLRSASSSQGNMLFSIYTFRWKGIQSVILLLVIVLCGGLTPAGVIAQQQNPQLVFDKANQQLQNGKIVQALEQYQSLVNRNQLSGALFINMGYGYLQLGELGKAKYYFLKAKQFEETQSIAQNGLEYVEENLSHQSVVLPALPWEEALGWLQNNMGAALLLGIGLIVLNTGAFIFIGTWFIKKPVKILPEFATGIAICGILILSLGFYIDYRQDRYSKAVLVTNQANVRKKPSAETPLVNKAYEGYSFRVDHQKSKDQSNWNYIRMSNGMYGWIQTKEIMIL